MIVVEVDGGSTDEKIIIEDAFWFALEKLMPRKQNLDVQFYVTDIPGDVDGYYAHVDKYEHNIEIQKGLPVDELITVVFHEMVHCMQHEQRRGDFEESIPYMERPTEIEAYKLQEELFSQWSDQHLVSL
jgi:hypothetical protein